MEKFENLKKLCVMLVYYRNLLRFERRCPPPPPNARWLHMNISGAWAAAV
jgi:hypothetical protein